MTYASSLSAGRPPSGPPVLTSHCEVAQVSVSRNYNDDPSRGQIFTLTCRALVSLPRPADMSKARFQQIARPYVKGHQANQKPHLS
ncbi:hypothetical protein CEXT_127641 [Caerostris extrusa]|uniref:Uncharacterized protein n=1 Tax=Caerostris extrusa TaxID=172846 RepID=A0AAV4V577_CAEEX|nr:hypothetical protein CEXT_127641 [Caerostris extrusa]